MVTEEEMELARFQEDAKNSGTVVVGDDGVSF